MYMPGLAPGALGWVVHRDFASAVEQLGHSFEMLTTTAAGSSAPRDAGPIRALPTSAAWQRTAVLAAPWLRTRQLLPSAAALAAYLRRAGSSVDVLHVEVAYPHGTAAALAAWASGWRGPLVVTPMGEDTLVIDEDRYGFRRHALPNALVKWTLQRAAHVRCISPLLERWIADLAPATPRRVVPLNVSAETAAAGEETPAERSARRLRARRALDSEFGTAGRPLVLSLGRLHPFKGIDTLVRAMPGVADAMLLIAGPSLAVHPHGDTAARLLRVADEVGVGNRVRRVGPIAPERALEILAGADVVAVPSRLESLNKVCIEAAAVGTPFVVTSTTGISAWVPEHGVGLVVPPQDPPALAGAIARVVTGQWQIDAQRCAVFVGQFSPRAVAAQVVEIYESVLAGHAQRHADGM